jgi:hypothetical protein
MRFEMPEPFPSDFQRRPPGAAQGASVVSNRPNRRGHPSSLGQWMGAMLALAPLGLMLWVIRIVPITGYA